jgi:hypothetical protein
MVATDWKRNFAGPNVLACAREVLPRYLPKSERLVSVTKIAYPHIGTKSAAFRILVDVTVKGKVVRVGFDSIAFYRGRAEASVMVTGPVLSAIDGTALKILGTGVSRLIASKMPAA